MKKVAFMLILALVVSVFAGTNLSYAKVFGSSDNSMEAFYWENFDDNDLIKNISQILILPNESMLCISDGRIVKSTDGGYNFTLLNSGIKDSIKKILLYKNILYALSSNTVYESTDLGTTWNVIQNVKGVMITSGTACDEGIYCGTFLGKVIRVSNAGVENIVEESSIINCLYYSKEDNELFIGTKNGLYIYDLEDKKLEDTNIPKGESAVFIKEINGKLFVLTYKFITHGDEHYINTFLWKMKYKGSFDLVKKFEHLAISGIYEGGNYYYGATEYNGVLYSNNLTLWKSLESFAGLAEIDAFYVDKNDNIFAYSKDELLEKKANKRTLTVMRKYFNGLQINTFFRTGGILYIGTNRGVFSKDSRNNLKESGLDNENVKVFSDFNAKIYAGSDNGVFVLGDNKWEQMDIESKVFAMLKTPEYLFIATGNGLYRISKDDNVEKINNLGFEKGVYSLCFYNGKLYAGTPFGSEGGLFVSDNNGNTWEQIPNTPGTDITSIYVTSGGIFIGTWVMGIYFTADNGSTWSILNEGLRDLNIVKLIHFKSALICGTTSGIYYYTGTAKVWKQIGFKLNNVRIIDIYPFDNSIFVSSWAGAFYLKQKPLIAKNDEGKIKLKWKSFPDDVKITKFELYRMGQDSKKWVLLKSFNGNTLSYEDASVKSGGKYVYLLKSFDSRIPANCFLSNKEEIILDAVPPDVLVNFPHDNLETMENRITIQGTATDKESGLASLTINGNSVSVSSDGSFSYELTLEKGENTITIIATDKAENKTIKTITVIYKPKTVITLQPNNPYMTVNGVSQEIDPGRGTKPVIIPKWGRTVVPIRAIVEALGGTISWDGKERKVTINLNDTTIELWIGKPRASVNGVMKWIDPNNHDVKPIIINSRTMLPLRFVAENLGCKVDWDPTTKTITITYPAS